MPHPLCANQHLHVDHSAYDRIRYLHYNYGGSEECESRAAGKFIKPMPPSSVYQNTLKYVRVQCDETFECRWMVNRIPTCTLRFRTKQIHGKLLIIPLDECLLIAVATASTLDCVHAVCYIFNKHACIAQRTDPFIPKCLS